MGGVNEQRQVCSIPKLSVLACTRTGGVFVGVEVLHDRNCYRVYCHEGSQKRRHILLEEIEKVLLKDRVQTRTKIHLEINLSFSYMICSLHDAVSMEISHRT